MILNKETKNKLEELKKLDLPDIIEIPYSYADHIHHEYIAESYTTSVNNYIIHKQKEVLNKMQAKHKKHKDDFMMISKNDWIYFLYAQI